MLSCTGASSYPPDMKLSARVSDTCHCHFGHDLQDVMANNRNWRTLFHAMVVLLPFLHVFFPRCWRKTALVGKVLVRHCSTLYPGLFVYAGSNWDLDTGIQCFPLCMQPKIILRKSIGKPE